MPLVRITFCWTVLLASLVLVGASCQPAPISSSKEYQGTVYYADDVGIWKAKLPSQEKVLLSNHKSLETSTLSLSPDQRWLAYKSSLLDTKGNELVGLWVISTQGGMPVQVSPDLYHLHMYWLNNSQLLYRDQQSTFVFDPRTGVRQTARNWEPRDECFMRVDPAGKGDKVESCRPTETSRGYLRVVNLDASHPITITEPYGVNDSAQWSPDGGKVLFMDGALDHEKLFIWGRGDGKMRQIIGEISQNNYTFANLSWSPDGQWIAFNGEVNDLCIARVVDGKVNCFGGFISATGLGAEPIWSPSSDAILISSNRVGGLIMGDAPLQWDLFIIGVPDWRIVRVTNSPEWERGAIWGR